MPTETEETETVQDTAVDDEQPKTFTQEQVNSAIATEKAKFKRSAEKAAREALAQEYGMTPEEVRALREERERVESEQLSEIEKQQRELAAKLAEADRREAETAKLSLELRVERALTNPEVGLVNHKAAPRLIASLHLALDATDEEIAEAINQLKEEMPEMFNTAEPDSEHDESPKPSGRSGVPGRGMQPPKQAVAPTSTYERGQERFKSKAATKPPKPLERFNRS